jgi:hypothetical protein
MSVEQASASGASGLGETAPWVQLFQKAHQKIVMLERLDEQMIQMLNRRQELQDELREIQLQINEEFNQRIKNTGDAPAKLLQAIAADPARRNGGTAPPRFANALDTAIQHSH